MRTLRLMLFFLVAGMITEPRTVSPTLPFVDWNAQTADLTRPLQRGYEKLQADLKKAEKALKDDIGF